MINVLGAGQAAGLRTRAIVSVDWSPSGPAL